MSETFTKGMARNIYYGGSLFFILVFLALLTIQKELFPSVPTANYSLMQ